MGLVARRVLPVHVGLLASALTLGLTAGPAAPAHADTPRIGWSLGGMTSLQSVLTDSAQAFDPGLSRVQRFGGLVANLGLNANVTLDVIGRSWDQGLIAGVALNGLIPTATPDSVAEAASENNLGFQAGLTYLARRVRPRYTLSVGGGYNLGINGQMGVGADGGLNAGGGAGATANGAQAGPLLIEGLTHNATARTELRLDRARWDADLALNYAFAANGVYTLGNPNPTGGALGAFVPVTTHTMGPTLNVRRRVGPYGTLVGGAGASWTLPVEVTVEDGLAQNILPETVNTNASLTYEHVIRDENRWFVGVNGTFGLRVPTEVGVVDANAPAQQQVIIGRPLVDPATGQQYGLQTDALVYTAEAGIAGRIRKLDVRYRLSAGVSQPRLFQPPLGGASAAFATYEDPAVGDIQPVGSLLLDRRFEPVDLSFTVQRGVAVGGLGASVLINHNVSLAGRYTTPLWSAASSLTLNAGVNVSFTRGAGGTLPVAPDLATNVQELLLTNNGSDAVGATIGGALPLLATRDGLTVDADAAYSFNYSNPGAGAELPPGQAAPAPELQAFTAHTIIVSVRGTFGRGPLTTAGDEERTEQNAYANDPRTGSPLVTARLLNLRGDSQERGFAPGVPTEVRARTDDASATKRAAAIKGGQLAGQSSSISQIGNVSQAQESVTAPQPPPPAQPSSPPPRRWAPADDTGASQAVPVAPIGPTPAPAVPPAADAGEAPPAGTTPAADPKKPTPPGAGTPPPAGAPPAGEDDVE